MTPQIVIAELEKRSHSKIFIADVVRYNNQGVTHNYEIRKDDAYMGELLCSFNSDLNEAFIKAEDRVHQKHPFGLDFDLPSNSELTSTTSCDTVQA